MGKEGGRIVSQIVPGQGSISLCLVNMNDSKRQAGKITGMLDVCTLVYKEIESIPLLGTGER